MALTYSLGPRLQTVASFVPKGSRLGDIGTDHAYLPIALYESGQILKAVAVDVHEGPYQSALAAVEGRRLAGAIDVRLGDGLMPLEPGEVNVLTLAGMGGRTMLDILSARPDVLEDVTELILQPQGAEGAVRLSLLEGGWRLREETLVKEEGRHYVIMSFSRKEGWNLADLKEKELRWKERLNPLLEKEDILPANFPNLMHRLVWHFGPLVLEGQNDLLTSYLSEYADMLRRRHDQMKKSNSSEIMVKLKEVKDELALVGGLQTWQ